MNKNKILNFIDTKLLNNKLALLLVILIIHFILYATFKSNFGSGFNNGAAMIQILIYKAWYLVDIAFGLLYIFNIFNKEKG